MHSATMVTAVCLALVAGGCHVDTSPRTVLRSSPGSGRTMKAKYAGKYVLYRLTRRHTDRAPARVWSRARSMDGATLVTVVYLKKGQRVGFLQQSDSPADTAAAGVVALAGGRRIPLSDGRYQWVAEPDPGQTDTRKVAELVAVGVAVTAIVGAIIIYQLVTTFPFGPQY